MYVTADPVYPERQDTSHVAPGSRLVQSDASAFAAVMPFVNAAQGTVGSGEHVPEDGSNEANPGEHVAPETPGSDPGEPSHL